MELSGGNYGGYAFITDKIKLEDIEIIVNFINESEFYILDENGDKWNYHIETERIIFSGVN